MLLNMELHLGLRQTSITTLITLKVLLAIMHPSNMDPQSRFREILATLRTTHFLVVIADMLLVQDHIREYF